MADPRAKKGRIFSSSSWDCHIPVYTEVQDMAVGAVSEVGGRVSFLVIQPRKSADEELKDSSV